MERRDFLKMLGRQGLLVGLLGLGGWLLFRSKTAEACPIEGYCGACPIAKGCTIRKPNK